MTLAYPDKLRYTDSHEYVMLEGDIATVGITSFAIQELGEIVFVELPEVEAPVKTGESFGTIESVKAVESLYSPFSGTVIERNDEASESPEVINDDPYGDGWLLKIRVDNPDTALASTLTAEQYQALVEGEG